jgi:hypothetical protein
MKKGISTLWEMCQRIQDHILATNKEDTGTLYLGLNIGTDNLGIVSPALKLGMKSGGRFVQFIEYRGKREADDKFTCFIKFYEAEEKKNLTVAPDNIFFELSDAGIASTGDLVYTYLNGE